MIRPLMITFAIASGVAITAGVGGSMLHAAQPAGPLQKPPQGKDAGAVVTRDFAWKAGPELRIGFPAEVTYIQGPESRMVATGSPAMLDKLKVKDGEVRLDINCLTWSFSLGGYRSDNASGDHNQVCGRDQPPLRIMITAPSTQSFEASGVANLQIKNYDQPKLKLEVSGAANARATGKAVKLDLGVSGASHADLTELTLTDATVAASGASHATLRATGKVDAHASGASTVALGIRPQSLKWVVSGASHIDQP